MGLSDALIEILRCPESGQRLRLADASELARITAQLDEGALVVASGAPLPGVLDGALIREDGRVIYPIVDGIPELIAGGALVPAP